MSDVKDLMEQDAVADCGFNYKIGDTIPKMENATARFGHAVLFGTKDTIEASIQQFYDSLYVKSENGIPMVHRLYPQK